MGKGQPCISLKPVWSVLQHKIPSLSGAPYLFSLILCQPGLPVLPQIESHEWSGPLSSRTGKGEDCWHLVQCQEVASYDPCIWWDASPTLRLAALDYLSMAPCRGSVAVQASPPYPQGHVLAVFTLKSCTVLKNPFRYQHPPLIALKVMTLAFSKKPPPLSWPVFIEYAAHRAHWGVQPYPPRAGFHWVEVEENTWKR